MFAGLIAGAVFGAVLSALLPDLLRRAMPALIGLRGGFVGWTIHLSFSAVFGVVFAALDGSLGWEDAAARSAALGLAYGGALWLVNVGFIWPLWLQTVGFSITPEFAYFDSPIPLAGHLLYGVVLGATYPYASRV